jgi:hypothetical protein
MRIRIRDPESFCHWIRQNSDPGSGINIPDPQHLLKCQLIILIPEMLATHFYNLCIRVPAAGGFRHCQPQRLGVQQQEAQVRYGNPALITV